MRLSPSPCGPEHPNTKCMVDGRCSKCFPKEFQEETLYGDDGYPSYKSPNDATTCTHSSGHIFQNCDVAPYNPYLSVKYNCRINCEICASSEPSSTSISTFSKAAIRPPLRSLGKMVVIKHKMKSRSILDAQYIFAIENCWHLVEFNVHSEEPTFYCIPIHLPDDVLDEIVDHPLSKNTALTAWIDANAQNLEGFNGKKARYVLYHEFPQSFVFDKSKHRWKGRVKGFAIGRMHLHLQPLESVFTLIHCSLLSKVPHHLRI